MKINNWKPEVQSLLKDLTAAGFSILGGHNGEERFGYSTRAKTEFLANLIACDESHLFVESPDMRKLTLYLVLGNSPGELVSDYTCHDGLDKVTEAHYEKWETRKQPTLEGEYLKGKFVSLATFQKAQRALVAEVNAVIHNDNLYAHVGFDGQDRRVVDCHINTVGEVVVRDLNDTRIYVVKYTAFRNGRGQEVKFNKI